MPDKKIETPEPDELLKHGGDGFREAKEVGLEGVQPHLDGTDMDASWRLRENRSPENLADGTPSEGLHKIAEAERREKGVFKKVFRKVNDIIGDLSDEEMWQVLTYGDTVDELTAQGKVAAEFNDSKDKKRMLAEAKRKFESATDDAMLNDMQNQEQEAKELERRERELLAKLKEKYGDD